MEVLVSFEVKMNVVKEVDIEDYEKIENVIEEVKNDVYNYDENISFVENVEIYDCSLNYQEGLKDLENDWNMYCVNTKLYDTNFKKYLFPNFKAIISDYLGGWITNKIIIFIKSLMMDYDWDEMTKLVSYKDDENKRHFKKVDVDINDFINENKNMLDKLLEYC